MPIESFDVSLSQWLLQVAELTCSRGDALKRIKILLSLCFVVNARLYDWEQQEVLEHWSMMDGLRRQLGEKDIEIFYDPRQGQSLEPISDIRRSSCPDKNVEND